MLNRPIKVLFLTRYPEQGASSRYRVYQYLPKLALMGVEADVQPFMDSEMYKLSLKHGQTLAKLWATCKACMRRTLALLRFQQYDIIYMQRELFPIGPPLIERFLKRRGAILCYDYDDALFIKKPSRFNPLATAFRSADKTTEIFKIVDCVVAGNNWLRDKAIEFGAKAVTIEVAEDTNRIPMRSRHGRDRQVTIGWLGSPSTVKYLREIEFVLQELARAFPELRFEVMGGGDFEMAGVNWHILDWSLEAELEALARFDIGLMPLPNETWAQGKSGGKARTYMAAGVVPVCSAIGYNLELIKDGETGLLCTTHEDWRQSLFELVQNAGLRQKIAVAARMDVQKRFSVEGKAQEIYELFGQLMLSATNRSL